MTQRNETNDDERKREREEKGKERGGKRGEAKGTGAGGRGKRGEGEQDREGKGRMARESGKDDSLNSAALPLGGCSSARPEPEFSRPVLQMSVWSGSWVWM